MAGSMNYASDKWWTPESVAIVTGSNKGIGREIARELSRQGLTTVIASRNSDLGMAAKEEIEGSEGEIIHISSAPAMTTIPSIHADMRYRY